MGNREISLRRPRATRTSFETPIRGVGLLSACFALFACASGPAPKAEFRLADYGPFPFRSIYRPDGGPPTRASRFGPVDDDLMARYDAELEQANPSGRFRDPAVRQKVGREFSERNRALFGRLQAELDRNASEDGLLSLPQAESLRTELQAGAVTGADGHRRYAAAGIGYCFGRAAYVHLRLAKRGVPAERIAKIYAFGRLLGGGSIWRYHMATMVQGVRDGERVWWVIDSLMPRVLDLRRWSDAAAKFSIVAGRADVRFYASEAEKFLPTFGEYSLGQLQDPEYRGYFDDLGQGFLRGNSL